MLRIPPFLSCVALVCVLGCDQQNPLAPTGLIVAAPPAQTAPVVRQLDPQGTMTAPDGTRILFRSNGQAAGPRPTVIVLALSAYESLIQAEPQQPRFAAVADPLVDAGWLAVSIDVPAHGDDARPGENSNRLAAWRDRLIARENFVAAFQVRLRAALDYLIAEGVTDAHRIALVGYSRGAFVGLHAAMADPRIRAVAGFVPLTDLSTLWEMAPLQDDPLMTGLALHASAARLARVPLWLTIGAHDERVGTAQCVALAEAVRAHGGAVSLSVEEVDGHTFTTAAVAEAVAWVQSR